MSTTTTRLTRLLDGDRDWGSLAISVTRHGVTRYRLVVFPPGLTPEQRRLLRVWRAWPTWGLAVWLGMEVALLPTAGTIGALVISTFAALSAGAVSMVLVDQFRREVRTLTVVRMGGINDRETADLFTALKGHATALAVADRDLTGAEHEAVVWRVYEDMAA
ncbi:MAG: hypothetical protein HYZ39_24835 [Mycolicibacterium cosmeticum]|nr:hypothetical protein [Mycolicibacterium cosmeticum]